MRLRKVEKLLHAVAQSNAEPLSTADRNQRLRQLETRIVGIGPWIHEPRHPFETIRRGYCQRRHREHRDAEEDKKIPKTRTGDE